MVARNLDDQFTSFHNPPPLDDSHWSQTSEEGSDVHSPVVYEHGFVHDNTRYHSDGMEYRTGYILPPPSLLSTGHHGLQVPDAPEHPSFQRQSPVAHSPTSLLHDIPPLSKAQFPAYDRIDHSGSSRLHTTKPSSSIIKTAQAGSKARPPRRSSANGVVACRQCRSRKIRCDSTRPGCENCARRSTQCEYDAAPKRRGPDKRPGTRRRSCKKRPADDPGAPSTRKRRRARTEDESDDEDDYEDQSISPVDKPVALPTASSLTINTEVPRIGGLHGGSSAETDSSLSSHRSPDTRILSGPSIDYHRRTWWDSLLDTYSTSRAHSAKDITADLSFLFSTHAFWLPFINSATFLQRLNDPNERMRMQPSLVIAALALATMIKSSDLELGAAGRDRARGLGDLANGELQAALTTGAIDHTLAEAALVLTVFEFCPHPAHSVHRANSHVVFLDSIIRSQNLTLLDSGTPDVSTFAPHAVPIVRSSSIYTPVDKCNCSVPAHSPVANEFFNTSQTSLPPWDPTWSAAEARTEECRRLCWSALSLVASQSVTDLATDRQPLDLFLSSPSNFSILFPGEVSHRNPTNRDSLQSPKESVWALYCRCLLLWSSCIRQKDEHGANADFAIDAWQETQAIQDSLDTHVCGGNYSLIRLCREYLHNSRMSITREFRRSLQGVDNGIKNMFNHRHAQDWLYYSDEVANRVRTSISQPGHPHGYALARNPLDIPWFTVQVHICIRLWNFDRSLVQALEVAKSFLLSVDILNNLFPCQSLSIQRESLHEELEDACRFSGVSLPSRPEYLPLPIPSHHHHHSYAHPGHI